MQLRSLHFPEVQGRCGCKLGENQGWIMVWSPSSGASGHHSSKLQDTLKPRWSLVHGPCWTHPWWPQKPPSQMMPEGGKEEHEGHIPFPTELPLPEAGALLGHLVLCPRCHGASPCPGSAVWAQSVSGHLFLLLGINTLLKLSL